MGKSMEGSVQKLMAVGNLEQEEFAEFLRFRNTETTEYLNERACEIRRRAKKDRIQIWGRIPISSFCKYDCKMCGIRRDNRFAKRYRMEIDLIMECCREFAGKGVRSFLLESGDDAYYTQQRVEDIIKAIQKEYPDSRIILSLGEKTAEAYQSWFHLGVSSYILRHGSANEIHFRRIFPSNMSLLLRKQCLWQLKEAGYETGTGFLVGVPYQSLDNVLEDIQFVKSFEAAIVDIGAFVPARHTEFERERSGNGDMVLYLMAIFRLMLPQAEIIASPTLDCVLKDGRTKAFLAGADVLVIDLAEAAVMDSYHIYERTNGRRSLMLDDLQAMVEQIEGLGLTVF